MTRVRVDFNSRGQDGTVRGSQSRADGLLRVGDIVDLYDPEEPEMNFQARVVELDPDTGRARFAVDWIPAASVRQPGARIAKVTSWGMIVPAADVRVPEHSPLPVGVAFA